MEQTLDDLNQIDSEELMKILSCFKYYRDKNYLESYSIIKNVLNWIDDVAIPRIIIKKEKKLCRCRPHTNGEIFFDNIDDISYRKDIFNIRKFGRANEPIQSIFYCSDDPIVAFTETSIVTRKNVDIDVEIYTTGIWEVINEFPLAHLIVKEFDSGVHTINPFIRDTLNHFKESLKKYEYQNEWIELLNFFSGEFMLRDFDDKHYKTTAAFANRIYDFVGEDHETFGGLIYPSAIYPEVGANLALKPEFVDKNLKLIGARRSTSTRVGEFEYLETHSVDCKEIDYKTGKIIWE